MMQKPWKMTEPLAYGEYSARAFQWIPAWQGLDVFKNLFILVFCTKVASPLVNTSNSETTFVLSTHNAFLSKAQGWKDFLKPTKPCHVGIHWIALTEYSHMSTHVPGFQSFYRFLHHFVLAKLVTSSMMVSTPSWGYPYCYVPWLQGAVGAASLSVAQYIPSVQLIGAAPPAGQNSPGTHLPPSVGFVGMGWVAPPLQYQPALEFNRIYTKLLDMKYNENCDWHLIHRELKLQYQPALEFNRIYTKLLDMKYNENCDWHLIHRELKLH